MSGSDALLLETAARLFNEARGAADFDAAWRDIEAAGFASLLAPEEAGGFGGSWRDAFSVFRLAGYARAPVPLGETILAARLGHDAGFDAVEGACSLAARAEGVVENGRFTGVLSAVPWGRNVAFVLAALDDQLIRLDAGAASVTPRESLAGEPRDVLTFNGAPVATAAQNGADVFGLAALLRTAQIAGAMDAALAMSIDYVNERTQFGRPISKFQAIQQSLAQFAEEAAAVNCAGDAAFAALARADADAGFETAAAKLRANMAAGVGAAIAHQVHGAIGFTQEHELHHYTTRLTAWRSEFGNDRYWARRLGRSVAEAGADAFWPGLARRSDAA